jgi:hypothetical protein
MADTLTIAYRPEFVRLPDEQGKPIGTDAALMLSQSVWLSEHRADEAGWFEWTISQCEEQTGLTRRQQQRLFPMLEALGYIKTDRRAENGLRHVRVCPSTLSESTKGVNRKARNVQTETEYEKGKHETCKPNVSESTKGVNRKARNVQTEAPAVSTQDTKTLRETLPPISPQEGEVRPKRAVFVPPAMEEVVGYMTEIGIPHLAAQWMAHYQANGWKVGRNPMKDWRAACRTWRETEKNSVRGSPNVTMNGRVPQPQLTIEESFDEEGEALRRIHQRRGGLNYG